MGKTSSSFGSISLSPRKRQICALNAQGRTNNEIAVELKISPYSVKSYIEQLFVVFDCHSRRELAVRFSQEASTAKSTRPNHHIKKTRAPGRRAQGD